MLKIWHFSCYSKCIKRSANGLSAVRGHQMLRLFVKSKCIIIMKHLMFVGLYPDACQELRGANWWPLSEFSFKRSKMGFFPLVSELRTDSRLLKRCVVGRMKTDLPQHSGQLSEHLSGSLEYLMFWFHSLRFSSGRFCPRRIRSVCDFRARLACRRPKFDFESILCHTHCQNKQITQITKIMLSLKCCGCIGL